MKVVGSNLGRNLLHTYYSPKLFSTRTQARTLISRTGAFDLNHRAIQLDVGECSELCIVDSIVIQDL